MELRSIDDRLTDRTVILPDGLAARELGASGIVCVEPPRVRRGHLTAKYAVVRVGVYNAAVIAHFYLSHQGQRYLVSSNSFRWTLVSCPFRLPVPLLEIDCNVESANVPEGELKAEELEIEMSPFDGDLMTPCESRGWNEEELPRSPGRNYVDLRPVIQSPVGDFLVLSGPRVKDDGCFLVKLIQLPPELLIRKVPMLKRLEAMLTVNGTAIGRIPYNTEFYVPVHDQLINPRQSVLKLFSPDRFLWLRREPVSVLEVFGAQSLSSIGPVPVSALRIAPEDPVDAEPPEHDA